MNKTIKDNIIIDLKQIKTLGIRWKYLYCSKYIEVSKSNYLMLEVWTTSNQWIKCYYICVLYYCVYIKIKKYKV